MLNERLSHGLDKDKWIGNERRRWSRQLNIPIVDQVPDGFPPLTLAVRNPGSPVSAIAQGSQGDKDNGEKKNKKKRKRKRKN
jgi:hypothetical protein